MHNDNKKATDLNTQPVEKRSELHVSVSLFMLCCLVSPQPVLNQAGLPQGPSDQKVVVVTVDNCDSSVALRFGHVIGNYTCSAQGSQSGSKK